MRRWAGLPADEPGPRGHPAAGGPCGAQDPLLRLLGSAAARGEGGAAAGGGARWRGRKGGGGSGRFRAFSMPPSRLPAGCKSRRLAGTGGFRGEGQAWGSSWKNSRNRVGGAGGKESRRRERGGDGGGSGWSASLEAGIGGVLRGAGETPWASNPDLLLVGE